jgi:DNA gyrase subunit A
VYRIKAYEITDGQRMSKGTPIVNFLNLASGEKVTAMIPIKEYSENEYLVCVTKNGVIKKTEMSQFDTSRKTGIIAVKLKDGDSLISIARTTGDSEIVIITRQGKSISFHENDVRPMGRSAGGVRAITLEGNDEVVAMELKNSDEELLVVTEMGYGKRTRMKEYKIQARGGKGMLTYDKSKFSRTGTLIGAAMVSEEDEVLLINSDGIIIRIKAGEVSHLSRATQGVKIMKVEGESNIIAMARMLKEDLEEEEGEAPAEDAPAPDEAPAEGGSDQIELPLE